MRKASPFSLRVFFLQTCVLFLCTAGLACFFETARPTTKAPEITAPEGLTHGYTLQIIDSKAPNAPALQNGCSLQQAKEFHTQNTAVFLDARDGFSYAQGHIQGALSLPVDDFDFLFPEYHKQLQNQTIVTYCDGATCPLGERLADLLRAKGLSPIYVLHNGWTAWEKAGLPTAQGNSPVENPDQ